MLTIEGNTLVTNLGILMPLGNMAAPGAVLTALMVMPEPGVDEEEKCPARPPTRAATSNKDSRVDHSVRGFLICDERGASSTKLELAPRTTFSDSSGDADVAATTGVVHDVDGAS